MSGVVPVMGVCSQPTPDPSQLAVKAAGELVGQYSAVYYPGYATCWVQLKPGSYSNGHALDGKLCCRKIGQISAGGACLTGCGSPPPDASSSYAVLAPTALSAVGKRCFTDCYFL